MELAKVYENDNLKSLIRKFDLEHKNDIRLSLKDSFTFAKSPISLTERFITKYKPTMSHEGSLLVQGTKGSITIQYDHGQLECSVKCEDFLNYSSVIEKVYLIDFVFYNKALCESMQTEFVFF